MAAIWLLALDTSTPCTALALGRVDRDAGSHELVVCASHDDRKTPASSLLAPRISALCGEAGITARQLGALASGVGPGMFTGTRVALATAKGLAFALPCPLFAVSTLAAVAGGAARDGEVLALLDARRGEVYAARFTLGPAGPQMQGEARCCPIAQVLSDMSEGPDLQVIGPGRGGAGRGAGRVCDAADDRRDRRGAVARRGSGARRSRRPRTSTTSTRCTCGPATRSSAPTRRAARRTARPSCERPEVGALSGSRAATEDG
jgi:tRNA threonylcarbamoyl adenosine modification protein YeaZ